MLQIFARSIKSAWLQLVLSVVLPAALMAQGEATKERLQKLDEQIRKTPRNAILYFMRGELYHVQENYDAALADFDKVSELSPYMTEVDLVRGQTLLAAGRLDQAKAALDKFLEKKPDDVDGLVTRARVQIKQGKRLAGAADFTAAISHSEKPDAQLYLERFEAFRAEGVDHFNEALHGLDEGIEKLGSLTALEKPAIELELQRKNYDAALTRLDKISNQFESKVAYLARRAEILEQAGRKEEARQAYMAALQLIEALPKVERTAVSSQVLEKKLRASLARLTDK